MLENLRDIFKLDPFMLLCIIVVIGLSLVGVYNWITQKEGTWSSYFITLPNKKSYSSVKDNPKDSRGETECRQVLESIFNRDFTKARPDFLSNPVTGGNNLELDCYNPELKLAVEYQGQQHYKYIPYFHKNKDAFQNQKYRDELKRRMCDDNMITLIEVPYTVKTENIRSYLIKELVKHGYILS